MSNVNKQYAVTVDLAQTNSALVVTNVAATVQQVTAVGFLTGPQGPKGDKGDTGATGNPGTNGANASISIGTVTTGAPGTAATVSNSGTGSAAVLNFTLPRGDSGVAGVNGSTWYSGAGTPLVTHSDGDYYLNTSNGDIYKQVSGAWGSPIENIQGPAGSGNMSGPASSVSGNIPTFADTTGKLLQDGGKALPTGSIVGTTDTQTLSNKRLTPKVVAVTASATPAINTDTTDVAIITGLTVDITNMTTNLTGTPTDGQLLEIRITDNGTRKNITWGASFSGSSISALPTVTSQGTTSRFFFEYDASWGQWACIGATGGNPTRTILTRSTNLTIFPVTGEDQYIICTSNPTITLPSAVGDTSLYTIRNVGGSGLPVTIATTASQTIDGASSYTIADRCSYTFISDGSNWNTVASSVFATRTFIGSGSSAAQTINTDGYDMLSIYNLSVNITGFTISGTPRDGQQLIIRIRDNGTPRTITWGAAFAENGALLPTTTVASKTTLVFCRYEPVSATWQVYAVNTQGDVTVTSANTVTMSNKTMDTASSNTIKINGNSLSASAGTATVTIPNSTDTLVGRATTDTLTNKRITPRVTSITGTTSPQTPNIDNIDMFEMTAMSVAMTIANPSGTPVDGQKLLFRLKDNGTARAITWGTSYLSSGVATLLSTTVINKTHLIGFIYDSAVGKWVCMAVDTTGY